MGGAQLACRGRADGPLSAIPASKIYQNFYQIESIALIGN